MANKRFKEISLSALSEEREKEETWKKFRSEYTFYKLFQGINNLRIISNPSQYFIHWFDKPDGGMARAVCTNDNNCDFCRKARQNPNDRKLAKKARFGFWILDRDHSNAIKMFETGNMVYNGILDLIKANQKRDITTYDIAITRNGERLETRYGVGEPPLKKKTLDPQTIEDAKLKVSDIPIELIIANEGKEEFIQDLLEEERVLNRNW